MTMTTAELLEAWRKAQRASDAARATVELARHTLEAAEAVTQAAASAARSAGVALDEADDATDAARVSYSVHEKQRESVYRDADAVAHGFHEDPSPPAR